MKPRHLAVVILYCLMAFPFAEIPAQTQAGVSSGFNWQFNGHAKYQFNYIGYPRSSIFHDVLGASSLDNNLDLRLKFSSVGQHWDFKADYQFIALYADTLELSRGMPASVIFSDRFIDDERRWWDLTHTIEDEGKRVAVQRLDRLSVGYTGEHFVWRFGRQAISWGNGMVFTPMDIFNPFDPAIVDKEYKPGDDMLYGQYLFDQGNDLQMVAVVRRDPISNTRDRKQSSQALKFHGFLGMNEYDLLIADHYGETLLGLGGIVNIGGAVWRSDLIWTDSNTESALSFVSGISWSWMWGQHNVSGLLEYFYNGFGQHDGRYSTYDLIQNPQLLERIGRGELFNLGRHYIASSVSIEISPLLLFTPNVFVNLEDPSALLQLTARYDWKQNLTVLAAINIPVGSKGTEYGGIEVPFTAKYLSTDSGVFAQLAWYF